MAPERLFAGSVCPWVDLADADAMTAVQRDAMARRTLAGRKERRERAVVPLMRMQKVLVLLPLHPRIH